MSARHGALWVVVLAALSAATSHGADLRPSQWLPGDDQIGPAASDQTDPAIAFGDGQYLVAWADLRADVANTSLLDYETSSDIYAIRLDAAGDPIDALPFAVAQAPAA